MSEHAVNSLPLQRTAEVPFAAYKRQQAALARRRLYPVTAFYTLYAILVLAIAFSTKHPWIAVLFFFAGCSLFTDGSSTTSLSELEASALCVERVSICFFLTLWLSNRSVALWLRWSAASCLILTVTIGWFAGVVGGVVDGHLVLR